MASLGQWIMKKQRVANHRPWPRVLVDDEAWQEAAIELADARWSMLGLWGDNSGEHCEMHLAVLDGASAEAAIITLDCPDRSFPSIGRYHAPAIRLERAAHDLFGLEARGAPDTRPWLDHGKWPAGAAPRNIPYSFLTTEGEGLHQIPVGPVHAGIIEPGHFRFTANGETVVRLEERLGYVHKGIEHLMEGADLADAARLVARVSGDSTVAYSLAFALAAEVALGHEVPARSRHLRALMAEMERLANHFGDVGAICNDASFPLMQAQCAILREQILRASDACFGHRLLMDRIVPGGTTVDLGASGRQALLDLISTVEAKLPSLIKLYDRTPSLQDRTVATGILKAALVRQFGAGGFVGRASGRDFDARRHMAYAPYDRLQFEVPLGEAGDVNARLWVRLREIRQSADLLRQVLAAMPDGPVASYPSPSGSSRLEGVAVVEGFRGDVLVWLRLDGEGKVLRCHPRDPSWFQWPLLEAAIEGNIVADFPLCNKSFNCSYSGHDL